MPTLVYSNLQTTASGGNLTSTSFTPQTGDVIVVKALREGANEAVIGTPTGGGWTYTQRVNDLTVGNCGATLWTAVVATGGTAQTVSETTPTPANDQHLSMIVELWRNAKLAASPATCDARGSGAPSTPLTTVAANSVVSWCNGDFAAVSPTGHTYNTTSATPTEDGLDNQSPSAYVAYYAYQSATSTGSQTLGLTAPTGQTWTLIGIEIQDAGSSSFVPQQKRRLRGGIRRTQTSTPSPAASTTSTGTVSFTGAASLTDPTVTFNPPATEIAVLSVTAASSLTENATELSNLTITASSSISEVATQQAILSLTGSSSLTDTAVQIVIAAFTASASWLSNATQIATLALTAASTFTSKATQLAILALSAASTFLGNVTQVCGLALTAASSIVLNAGGAVTGTISMTAGAVWSSVSQINSPVTFSAVSTFTGNAVQSASVALSALASVALKPVSVAKAAFSAAASWVGSLVTGTLYGTSDVGGRELGGSAGKGQAPDNYPASGAHADNYPKSGQAPDSSTGGRAL